jgi:hypothetical protein
MYVGLDRISQVLDHSDEEGHFATAPHFSYLDGKPKQLLVLDSTWDTLVYVLEKAQKQRSTANKQQGKMSSLVVLGFILFYEVGFIYFGDWYELFACALAVMVAVLGIFMLNNANEKLMNEILEEYEIRQLFERDGYHVTVKRIRAGWPCCPRPVSLLFERRTKGGGRQLGRRPSLN